MSLNGEKNVDLGYDTEVLRNCATKFQSNADLIRGLMDDMQTCLDDLTTSEWTTNAGKAFEAMVGSNWKDNMDKYAGFLEMLNQALTEAAAAYDDLTTQHIETLKLD